MTDTPNSPFSGDVHQAINPWSWWANMMGQAGFININNINAGDSELEKDIIENVASYGRQLGRIIPVVEVLLTAVDVKKLDIAQQAAVADFKDLAARLEMRKASQGGSVTPEKVAALVEKVDALKESDPATYAACMIALKSGLKA